MFKQKSHTMHLPSIRNKKEKKPAHSIVYVGFVRRRSLNNEMFAGTISILESICSLFSQSPLEFLICIVALFAARSTFCVWFSTISRPLPLVSLPDLWFACALKIGNRSGCLRSSFFHLWHCNRKRVGNFISTMDYAHSCWSESPIYPVSSSRIISHFFLLFQRQMCKQTHPRETDPLTFSSVFSSSNIEIPQQQR